MNIQSLFKKIRADILVYCLLLIVAVSLVFQNTKYSFITGIVTGVYYFWVLLYKKEN